ncbi:MAG: hypothetical protein ACKVQC_03925 [Elusimicrobiota bacterium]
MATRILERIIPQKRHLIFNDIFGETILLYYQWFGVLLKTRALKVTGNKNGKCDLLVSRQESLLELNAIQKPPFIDHYLSHFFSIYKNQRFFIQYLETAKIKIWLDIYLNKGFEIEAYISYPIVMLLGILAQFKSQNIVFLFEGKAQFQVILITAQKYFYVSCVENLITREERLIFLKKSFSSIFLKPIPTIDQYRFIVLRENSNLQSLVRDLKSKLNIEYISREKYLEIIFLGLKICKRNKLIDSVSRENKKKYFFFIGIIVVLLVACVSGIFIDKDLFENKTFPEKNEFKAHVLPSKKPIKKNRKIKPFVSTFVPVHPTPSIEEVTKSVFLENVKLLSIVHSGHEPLALLEFKGRSKKLVRKGEWIDNFLVSAINESSQQVDFLIDQKILVSLFSSRK